MMRISRLASSAAPATTFRNSSALTPPLQENVISMPPGASNLAPKFRSLYARVARVPVFPIEPIWVDRGRSNRSSRTITKTCAGLRTRFLPSVRHSTLFSSALRRWPASADPELRRWSLRGHRSPPLSRSTPRCKRTHSTLGDRASSAIRSGLALIEIEPGLVPGLDLN